MPRLINDITTVTKTGVFPGLSREDYFELPGLNPSSIAAGIRKDRVSPLFIKDAYEQSGNDEKTTDSKLFGTLTHLICFEPDRFKTDVAVWKGGRRAGKEWNDFVANHEGQLIVKEQQYHDALSCLMPLISMKEFQDYISAGASEVGVFTEISGLQCKGELDWISSSIPSIWDLKTARDIEPGAFGRQFFELKYDVKLGTYREMLKRQGMSFDEVCIAAVRNTPPWDAVLYRIPEEVLDRGWEKAHEVIESVAECLKLGIWPGAGGGTAWADLEVPYWAMSDEVDWA